VRGARSLRRTLLVTCAASALLGAVPVESQADSPIVGRWVFEGGEVSVERAAGPSLYQGVVIRPTTFSSCTHRAGQPMWRISGGGPRTFSGSHFWYRVRDCTFTGWGPTTWTVDTSDPERYTMEFCTTNPGDPGDVRCHTLEQARPDTDGDGLIDQWETEGINTDDDPEPEVDLPAMGADPEFKDIFVEMDWMPHHHLSNAGLRHLAEGVFLPAPVANPSGSNGIALHVDNGPSSLMDPRTGSEWGELSKSHSIRHEREFGSSAGDDYSFDEFDGVKEDGFSDDRELAFRYALSVHSLGGTDDWGISRGEGSSDFIVALGGACGAGDCSGTLGEQEPIFMHELGHTLGLEHGGQDDINYKPNYLSVMNYSYSLTGIPARDLDDITLIDYSSSRWGAGTIDPLDESALSEAAGPQAGPGVATRFRALWYCPDSDPESGTPRETRFNISTNWDCDASVEGGTVPASINGDADQQTLRSYEDWSQLQYRAGAIGDRALAGVLPATAPTIEADPRDLLPAAGVVMGDSKRPRVKLRSRGGRIRAIARDNEDLFSLIVSVDGKQRQVKAKGQRRKAHLSKRLKRGRHRIKASALDEVGNPSKPKRLKVRVR
jgi:hypothetical protein